MSVLGMYRNNNYTVTMMSDGTKIRAGVSGDFEPSFPESIDIKISDRCDRGCLMCHESSTPSGGLADLSHPILETLRPYTELAVGGGNPLEHPGLVDFLVRMKNKGVICNMTVHLDHFCDSYELIKELTKVRGLVHGLGVSVTRRVTTEEVGLLKSIPNVVLHIIAGIMTNYTLLPITNRGFDVLVLGYKDFGRGSSFYEPSFYVDEKIEYMRNNIDQIFQGFNHVSFDNIAISQLYVKNLLTNEDWNKLYMGDDGQFTMYIDLVKNEYAVSSVSERKSIPENSTIDSLFASVRSMRSN